MQAGQVSYDHVIDEMLKGLGLKISCEQAPFEPEPGAYVGASLDDIIAFIEKQGMLEAKG